MNSSLPGRKWSDVLQHREPSLESLRRVRKPTQLDPQCANWTYYVPEFRTPCHGRILHLDVGKTSTFVLQLDSKSPFCLLLRKSHPENQQGRSQRIKSPGGKCFHRSWSEREGKQRQVRNLGSQNPLHRSTPATAPSDAGWNPSRLWLMRNPIILTGRSEF